MNPDGSQLIYLISQPRSGSTLLQRILNMHPEIYSETEAWFMLHFVYGLRDTGIETEYNVQSSQTGLTTFLAPLQEGTQTYLDAIRAAALTLYGRVLESQKKSLLLDKTPRYYHIVDELKEIFPRARFILLVRNPLAVLASLLSERELRSRNGWIRLARPDSVHDILTAPSKIASFMAKVGDEAVVVRYEDLVTNPEETVRTLCKQLDVEFFPQMLRYKSPAEMRSVIGDRRRIGKHDKPVPDYVDAWKTTLESRVQASLAYSYLEYLGIPLLDRLGYSYQELVMSLPDAPSRRGYSRAWKLITTPESELPWWRRLSLQTLRSLRARGIARSALRAAFLLAGRTPPSRQTIRAGRMR